MLQAEAAAGVREPAAGRSSTPSSRTPSVVVPDLILAESARSFLGLGVRVPTPSWGNMLDEAQRFYRTNWINFFIPGLTIYLTSLYFYLVGIGLRDVLDPRLHD